MLAQFALLVVLAVEMPGPRWTAPGWVAVAGLILVVVGIGYVAIGSLGLGSRTLTATPVPRATASLQTAGLYRWSRHPLYTGVIVIGLGLALRRVSVVAVLALIALVVLLDRKARYEEALLVERYPEYGPYRDRTPRFFPGIRTR